MYKVSQIVYSRTASVQSRFDIVYNNGQIYCTKAVSYCVQSVRYNVQSQSDIVYNVGQI